MADAPDTRARAPLTFVEQLIRDIVEPVRGEILGDFGVRPYRLFLVTMAWSGQQEGRGVKGEKERIEIGCGRDTCGRVTPPLIIFSGSWSSTLHGRVDEGEVRVEEIAGSFIETELVNYGRLHPGEESFFEIVQDARDGTGDSVPVGRYALMGKPSREGVRGPRTPTGYVMRLRAQEPGDSFGVIDR